MSSGGLPGFEYLGGALHGFFQDERDRTSLGQLSRALQQGGQSPDQLNYQSPGGQSAPDQLNYQSADMIANAKKAYPLYQQAVQKYNLPPEAVGIFMGQTYVESKFNPDAVGPITPYGKAHGIAQFIPSTAAQYGLTDPMNMEASIDAQARYMRDLLKRYGG